jgi:hypothetical protein
MSGITNTFNQTNLKNNKHEHQDQKKVNEQEHHYKIMNHSTTSSNYQGK